MDQYTSSLLESLRSTAGVRNVKFTAEDPCSSVNMKYFSYFACHTCRVKLERLEHRLNLA
uniref:Uncharacterized protein n=1 Tax=Tetraselmis sp. GSL018 TaxID=582737 RepID=A0A061SJM9_9CHLO